MMTNDIERVTPDITFVTERFGDIGVHQAILELLNENKRQQERIDELSDLLNILIGRIAQLETK